MKSIVLLILLLSASCSIKRPAQEEVIPHESGIEKDFFIQEAPDQAQTFLTAYAPVSEIGRYGEQWHYRNVASTYHANIKFFVEESLLVGKLINPSFPNNPEKWQTMITIPIVKHYYLEKKKDQYGRELNEMIENSNRSHWSARPNMKLNFTRLQLHHWSYKMTELGDDQIQSVEDIIWDKKDGYLAFTVSVSASWLGAMEQVKYRFNFKAFDPAGGRNFVKTPYHGDNSKYLNILHLIGKKVDGVSDQFTAAHWDLSKDIPIHLNGFPDKYVHLAKDALAEWNVLFEKLGLKGRFVPIIQEEEPKYMFDLRKPSITWISDKRTSMNAPLGIGQAQANMLTGEILWGGVVIWGGMIEDYMRHYAPHVASTGNSNAKLSYLGAANLDSFTSINPTKYASLTDSFKTAIDKDLFDSKEKLTSSIKSLLKIGGDLPKELNPDEILQKMHDSGQEALRRLSGVGIPDIQNSKLSIDPLGLLQNSTTVESIRNEFGPNVTIDSKNYAKTVQNAIMGDSELSILHNGFNPAVTLSSISSEMSAAFAELNTSDPDFSLKRVTELFIKDLIIHEVGHLLGIGHNFKENILPEKGTIPQKEYEKLTEMAFRNGGEMANFSTVMGYRHPLSVFKNTYEEIKPGIHDEWALRYLYLREYPLYNPEEKQRDEFGNEVDDFVHQPLPANGKIRRSVNKKDANGNIATYKVAYVPTCNDFDASFYQDPYCNRHDRGHDALSIITNYLNDLTASINRYEKAFSDHRANYSHYQLSYYIFRRSLRNLTRVRLFYDYMRSKYDDQLLSLGEDQDNLLQFSESCTQEIDDIKNKTLRRLFDQFPDLKDLCQANKFAIENVTNYLAKRGSDFTEMDFSEANTPSGIVVGDASSDYSRMDGTWSSISTLYTKISAVLSMFNPSPLMPISSYIIEVPKYSGTYEIGAYSYFTFYPYETNQMVAKGVENNMQLLSEGNKKSIIQRTLLFLSSYVKYNLWFNNDNTNYSILSDHFKRLSDQYDFSPKIAFIVLTPRLKTDSSDKMINFTASEYSFFGGNEQLGSAYLLPNKYVMVQGNGKKFYFPLTSVYFINKSFAFFPSISITYTKSPDDPLEGKSPKEILSTKYQEAMRSCVYGDDDGLYHFFSENTDPEIFPGFTLLPGIESDLGPQNEFYYSIDKNFDRYEEQFPNRKRSDCLKSFNDMGLISMAASAIGGYFLPYTFNYLIHAGK